MFDGVLFILHLLHFFARPVFCRVRHRMPPVPIGHHFQNVRPLPCTARSHRLFTRRFHRQNIHAVNLLALDAIGRAPPEQRGRFGRPLHARAHRVVVVFNHEYHRQVPQLCHVIGLVHLPLVRRPVAEIGKRHIVIAQILVRKGEASPQRHLRAHNAMPAIKMLFLGEHVHAAPLTLGIAALTARQFCHNTLRVHPAGQHMAVVAVTRQALVTRFGRSLQAYHDRLLADVQMAKPADQTHAIQLARLFLKPADQQHFAVVFQQVFLRNVRFIRWFLCGHGACLRWVAKLV